MESFLINYKNKIIGIYTDIEQAKLFINSCLSNNLMIGSAEILIFTTNSCYCTNKINITLDKLIIPNNKNNYNSDNKFIIPNNKNNDSDNKPIISNIINKEIDYNDPIFLKLTEDKIVIQHKINMLKVMKEKIKESKEVYNHDINLYNKFKQNLINDNNFIIPELFTDKFLIFKKLDNENRLDCDNFLKEYDHNNTYEEYFKLNSYDKSFSDLNKKNEINEEIEINSDAENSDNDSDNDSEKILIK